MPAVNLNETIEQGATFYRLVSLFSDADKTIPYDLTNKTPRATLMTAAGQHVANFGCAIQGGDPSSGVIVWTMPRAVTATLVPAAAYMFNIDLDDADGVTTDRAVNGSMTVKSGQVH